ncbi:MAG: thioredoxin family protein [Planctomycetales bacterium]|nr:thioredoxin family protein [Planctomycetales bacterium]
MRAATLFALVTSLILIQSTASFAQSQADIVPWQTDLNKAMQIAKEQNKPLLLHFWSPTCQPCLKLDRNVFSQQSVAGVLSDFFVPVKINGAAQPAIRAHYKVEAYPTDVVVLPNNEVVEPGMVTPQNPQQYISRLTAIAFRTGMPARNDRPASQNARERYPENDRFAAADQYQTQDYTTPQIQASSGGRYESANDFAANAAHSLPDDRFEQYRNNFGRYADTVQPRNDLAESSPQQSGGQQYVQNPYASGSVANGSAHAGGRWVYNNTVTPPATERHQQTNSQNRSASTDRQFAPTPDQQSELSCLENYCPVTLIERNSWKKGDKQFGVIHRGRLYHFAGEAEKRIFLNNPDQYSPFLGGIDPVEHADSGRVEEGRREFGEVYEGQIYFFANEANLLKFEREVKATNSSSYVTRILQAMQASPDRAVRR